MVDKLEGGRGGGKKEKGERKMCQGVNGECAEMRSNGKREGKTCEKKNSCAMRGGKAAERNAELMCVDLSAERLASRSGRVAAAEEVTRACREVGFFYAIGRREESELCEELIARSRDFFALPATEKEKLRMSSRTSSSAAHSGETGTRRGSAGSKSVSRIVPRGYFGIGEEKLVDAKENDDTVSRDSGDLKEGLDMGASPVPTPIEEDTRWPTEVASGTSRKSAADFRRVAEEYSRLMLAFATSLMEVFGIAANAPSEDFFVENSRTPVATLRVLHYPGTRAHMANKGGEGQEAMGLETKNGSSTKTHDLDATIGPDLACGAHSDYGLCTILADGGVPGLQVLRPGSGDQWVNVHPIEGAFIINTGAMMHRLTGGHFQNTIHRVVHAPGVANRISVPFFFNPSPSAVIEPMSQQHLLQQDVHSSNAKETCADIISRRYVQSGLAVSSFSASSPLQSSSSSSSPRAKDTPTNHEYKAIV